MVKSGIRTDPNNQCQSSGAPPADRRYISPSISSISPFLTNTGILIPIGTSIPAPGDSYDDLNFCVYLENI